MKAHVLIADDDPRVLAGVNALCAAAGYRTSLAHDGAEALEAVPRLDPDLVLVDLDMPGKSGLEVLEAVATLPEGPSVILMTGRADVPTAVRAMRVGAVDFLEKPVSRATLEGALERGLLHHRFRKRCPEDSSGAGTDVPGGPGGPGAILGETPAVQRLLSQIERVAGTPRTTVLVRGESGTGKELVARAVHQRSERSQGPFVALNCSALTDSLLEAELFGYEAGAFTGAAPGGRDGLCAAAQGGTLFLDEVGELAPALQAKLLRVLQERSFRRVGSSEDRSFDARIVASTNRDLEAMVQEGTFREDLFYRLNVMSIAVPPLRERRGDIGLLAGHFLADFEQEFGKRFEGLAEAAIERLLAHSWPGNVRELRNTLERAALLSTDAFIPASALGLDSGELEGAVGPPDVEGPPAALPAGSLSSAGGTGRSLRAIEEAWIRQVLEEEGGNRSRAARVLGVNRTTLYNKLKRYGIEA